MSLAPIHYLRWARSRELDPESDLSLILSGMLPPPPEMLGEAPALAESLRFDHRDQPALARRMAADLGCEPAELLLQPGTHGALFTLLAARLAERPGPVLVEEPAYEPLRRIPTFLGARVLRLPRPRARHYDLDWDALDAARAQRPSVLLLSHPHNPSGALLGPQARARILDWCDENDCVLLSDEVYLEFVADPASSLRHGAPQVMKVGSFTKVMGLGGLRVGYCIGPVAWLRAAAEFSDYGPLAIAAPSQALAARAWTVRDTLYERARAAADAGRAVLVEWLERHRGELDAFVAEAGIISFPRPSAQLHQLLLRYAARLDGSAPHGFGLDAHRGGSHEWIRALARAERVHLTPGAFFEDPMAFRLGYGSDTETLREALTRLDRFLARAKEMA